MDWCFPLTIVLHWWSTTAPYFSLLLQGSKIALQMTVLTLLFGSVFGLIAVAMKTSRFAPVRGMAQFYVWFVRGTPLLVKIFIIFFGLPQLGINLPPYIAGAFALAIHTGAYIAEIIRGGLLSIPKGQHESAAAIGMTYRQTMQWIILPQVIRVVLPPMTNQFIITLKETPLLSTIGVMELTLTTNVIVQSTYRPFEFYIMSAFFYLAMTSMLTYVMGILEKRCSVAYGAAGRRQFPSRSAGRGGVAPAPS
jgi:polar amino acid transport system permease protein